MFLSLENLPLIIGVADSITQTSVISNLFPEHKGVEKVAINKYSLQNLFICPI